MSELTPCNWCSVRSMERRAAKQGRAIVLSRDDKWGIAVHEVAVDENGTTGDTSDADARRIGVVQELTLRCVC